MRATRPDLGRMAAAAGAAALSGPARAALLDEWKRTGGVPGG